MTSAEIQQLIHEIQAQQCEIGRFHSSVSGLLPFQRGFLALHILLSLAAIISQFFSAQTMIALRPGKQRVALLRQDRKKGCAAFFG